MHSWVFFSFASCHYPVGWEQGCHRTPGDNLATQFYKLLPDQQPHGTLLEEAAPPLKDAASRNSGKDFSSHLLLVITHKPGNARTTLSLAPSREELYWPYHIPICHWSCQLSEGHHRFPERIRFQWQVSSKPWMLHLNGSTFSMRTDYKPQRTLSPMRTLLLTLP